MESGNKRKRGKRGRDKNNTNNDKSSLSAVIKQMPSQADHNNNKSSSKRSKRSGGGRDSSFLDKMRAKLSGGHFRMINEKLYTCSGNEAFKYFEDDPSLFNTYHTGYQEQMSHWPEQPVNIIIKWLKGHDTSLIVADFGCGDARLAKNVKNKVFSFDLVSHDPSVIACDMSNTRLGSSSVNVAVFCLSLMGTDFPKFLQEAQRVLNPGGWLLIAEVKSRFDPNTGGADPDRFVKAVCELGFTSVSKDFSNKMFLLFYFRKEKPRLKEDIEWPKLKPCLYKRR
ncbi:hypothetical protein GIB67_030885 [Kingdonia uniflora]|uniref:Ribosomal RNA-processing protein 8 n=1 Tax=Kingdonia uniflora TaxID=39325 RepID=A0A7J7L3B5_9MAGN|nr:hypothetical protein GIB67_030885 [Kingdonia uniflora]